MIRLLLFVCFLCISSFAIQGQSITLEGNALLRYLNQKDSSVSFVRFMNEGLEIQGPTYKDNLRVKTLIRSNNGLFLMIYGKGRVYKVLQTDAAQTVIERIDSTLFFGNNFNALDFSYQDTLFSFGGYGFWRFNGQLRYFIEGGEWNIVQLNDEEPINTEMFMLDFQSQSLFYIQAPLKQEYMASSSNKYYLCQLDLGKRTVQKLGEIINPKLLNSVKRAFALPLLNGIMIESDGIWYLLQPGNNRILKLINQSVHNWFMAQSTYHAELCFADSNKILSYSRNEDTLRTVTISFSDFSLESDLLYLATIQKTKIHWLWFFPLLIFLIIVFIYRKQIFGAFKSIQPKGSSTVPDTLTLESDSGFTEVEKSLIQAIISRKGTDTFVTVEELNYMLGLSKKSIEIQKKVRRETLNRINSRFRELSKINTDLIQAERSQTDRRFYNYFISKANADQFKLLT